MVVDLPANHITGHWRSTIINLVGPRQAGQTIQAKSIDCLWRSDIDGVLSHEPVLEIQANNLSEGIHTLTFSIQDLDRGWSIERTVKLFIANRFYRIYAIDPEPA
jgi:hypothetical protein